ncbi:hypothetical protein BJ165DRAFT_1327381, partial [Panaeolus papilionaceus]
VIDKYLGLIWNCDLYILALVMCPDRKLEWFQDPARNLSAAQINHIRSTAVSTWKKKYAPANSDVPLPKQKEEKKKGKSKWEPRPKASHKTFPDDHIETYLLEPVISPKVMDDVGGYISYW